MGAKALPTTVRFKMNQKLAGYERICETEIGKTY